MLRRDFLRLAVVGTCSAVGVAHAAGARGLHAVPVAHASIGPDADAPRFEVDARALREAAVTHRDVDAHAYFARFGLRPGDLGIDDARVTVLSTPLPDALGEIVESRGAMFVVWDGVAYRLEAA
jgi:hypothetical protein